MEPNEILISGASVAGPALAWWLARRGFRPVIVERSGRLRGGGYAVDFRGQVHLSVLEQMGLLEDVRARQTHLSSISYVNDRGEPVASLPPVFFAGDVEILRGDLAEVLYRATKDDTPRVGSP
jgi:2-polyprenyl-6-methoxyphenol hydroxylase-like FAD-dependent oxidoreductase